MVDTVSIIIAIISLLGSLSSAALTAYITYYLDRTKRRSETRALTDKYRDPLTLSAYELQSRFWNITEGRLLSWLDNDTKGTKTELVRVYTAFLVGQYFSWVFIFRREARFLRFSTDVGNREMNRIMDGIVTCFGTDRYADEGAFLLWRGQQMAIGELMTERDHDGQLCCIGYAAFALKYEEDLTFRKWFLPVEEGITEVAQAQASGNTVAANRLRRLQHLLVDLTVLLGNDLLTQGSYVSGKVVSAPNCSCKDCWPAGWLGARTVFRKSKFQGFSRVARTSLKVNTEDGRSFANILCETSHRVVA